MKLKRIILITVIFLAAVACERYSAAEPPPVRPTPSPPAQKENTDHKSALGWSWETFIALGTVALVLVTWQSIRVANRTEGVFKEIVKTLETNASVMARTQDRAQARADEAENVRTMRACIAEYQRLEDKRQAEPPTIGANRYFELLWNLHFAEFHYFKRGFLPAEVYGLWVFVRYQDYHKNEAKLGKTEFDGWDDAKKYLRDDAFENFVRDWLEQPNLKREAIDSIIMKHGPPTNSAKTA